MSVKNSQLPLVSVVIPIYKVEKFMDACVSSVINQTYTNLEIILVDDGSPDACPQMCEVWARKDNRVHVLHKENGGLSDARNYGIEHANGDYLYFVDSDDRLDTRLLEKAMGKLLQSGADMVFFQYRLESEDGGETSTSKDTPAFPREGYYSAEQGLEKLWSWQIPNYAWSYVARAQLFETVRFPKGELMEDVATTYRLVGNARHGVYFLPEELYFYRIRKGSILGHATPRLCTDNLPHIEAVDAYAKERYPQLLDVELNWSLRFLIGDLFQAQILRRSFADDEFQTYKHKVKKLLDSHYRELGRRRTNLSNRLKLMEIRCGLLPLRSYITYLRHRNTR